MPKTSRGPTNPVRPRTRDIDAPVVWAWSEESRGAAGRGECGVVDSDGVCVKV